MHRTQYESYHNQNQWFFSNSFSTAAVSSSVSCFNLSGGNPNQQKNAKFNMFYNTKLITFSTTFTSFLDEPVHLVHTCQYSYVKVTTCVSEL
jgi:hypothetical protein